MSNHEQDNDYLSIDDLLWALGLEPKPVKADSSPKESFPDEAASLTEASSPLVGASDDEAVTPPSPLSSSAALISEFNPLLSSLAYDSDPPEFPSSRTRPLAAEEYVSQPVSSHSQGETGTQLQPDIQNDVTAVLPTHEIVAASAPSYEAVTAQMPPIIFPDKSAKQNKTERERQDGEPAIHLHHESSRMVVHSEDGTMPVNAESERLELLGKPEPAPIYIPKTTKVEQFFDKIKSRNDASSSNLVEDWDEELLEESASADSASVDGEKVTSEESTFADVVDSEDGTDGEKATTEKSASHFEQASNVTFSRSRIFTCILIALAAFCLIVSLSLILTSLPSGNQEARDSDKAAASVTSLCDAEWTTTYHYTTTDSGGTSYSTTEIAQFDTNGTLIDSVAVIECKGADQAKAFLSQAEKDYGDTLTDSTVCNKTVLLKLDGGQGGLTREAYSKMLMDTKDDCQVAIGK